MTSVKCGASSVKTAAESQKADVKLQLVGVSLTGPAAQSNSSTAHPPGVLLRPPPGSASVMSHCDSFCQQNYKLCACWEDEGRRMKRREKNRVAAQRSRRRQTQRADQLHQACELLEQRNRKLRREVDALSEEQNLLTEALRAHEPLCPIMHCSFTSSDNLQPEDTD